MPVGGVVAIGGVGGVPCLRGGGVWDAVVGHDFHVNARVYHVKIGHP